VTPEKITGLIKKEPWLYELTPDYVLRAKVVPDEYHDLMEATKKVLQALSGRDSDPI
jgi:hypothetical protein